MDSKMQQVRLALIDLSHNRTDANSVKAILEGFIADVKTIKQKDRETFIKNNLTALAAIKFELDYVTKLPEMKAHKFFILYRDLLFGSLLRQVHIINESSRVTKVFNEFIKGITAFSDEEVFNASQPNYHRKKSCPKRGSQNIKCNSTNTSNVKKEKADAIKKCYIERMIYDNIWATIMHCAQDKGHIEWLINTQDAYKTCHPDRYLQIDIEYTDRMIPITLKIYDNDDLEVYEKRYDEVNNKYLAYVDCIRYEGDTTKRKTNEFEKEGAWVVSTL